MMCKAVATQSMCHWLCQCFQTSTWLSWDRQGHWPADLFPRSGERNYGQSRLRFADKRVTRLRVMFVLLLTITGCNASVDPAISTKFQAAQDQFEQAADSSQFLQAAAMYQEILDADIESSVVLYNQGNAFMRAGQRGRAIACYRQAKRYRPRDPYLDANLRYALGDKQEMGSKSIVETILFWNGWISYYGKFQAILACALVTFGISVTSLYIYPRLFKRIATIALGITIAITSSAAYDWYRFTHIKHGVVIANEVIARKGDSETYEPAFTKPLDEGTECRILDQRAGWMQIQLKGDQVGWVLNESVAVY